MPVPNSPKNPFDQQSVSDFSRDRYGHAARSSKRAAHASGQAAHASRGGEAPRPDSGAYRASVPYHAGAPRNPGTGAHRGAAPAAYRNAAPAARSNAAPAAHWGVGGNAQPFDMGNAAAKKRKNGPWTAVLVIAVLVLVLCLAVLGMIGYGYWHGSKVYTTIAEQAFPEKEADALSAMTVDWDALLAQNPDTVAWIYMPGTSIDYPVVQGDSDEEYLKKDFTGDSGGIVHKGTIFLATDNAGDFSDENNVLYGHNMNDDTMFAHLLQMTDQATFDAARTFYVLTPTQNYRCSTFALDVVDSTQTDLLQYTFSGKAALQQYMDERKSDSVVSVPNDVDSEQVSKLFTLITCGDDYAATRAVLFGAVVESATPTNAS